MRIVTAQELESWLSPCRVLEKDARGPKVVVLQNGLFLKIFHTRRQPWLARLRPAAMRFAQNAARLQDIGVPAPNVVELLWLNRQEGLSACTYEPLPGQSVEQLYRQAPQQVEGWLPALAKFICQLHRHGIYFRSLHLGNIVLLPNGEHGLIDILDLQFKPKPLTPWLIKRNFQHMQNYLSRRKLTEFPAETLIEHYRKCKDC